MVCIFKNVLRFVLFFLIIDPYKHRILSLISIIYLPHNSNEKYFLLINVKFILVISLTYLSFIGNTFQLTDDGTYPEFNIGTEKVQI